jgi:glutathione S-transferase
MAPKLYGYEESGNCYKVRLLAALLSINLEHVAIDFDNDQNHSDEFLAINPRGSVPTLVDGDKTFTDSSAILVYLAGTHADPQSGKAPSSYWSVDVAEQAAIVDWLAFANSWVQYGVCIARSILNFGGPYNGLGTEYTDQTLAEAMTRGHKSLVILNKQLNKNEWLALGRPTVADVAVFVYVALAPMADVSIEPYPAVKSWIARVKKLPNFIPIIGLDEPLYHRRR